MISRIVHPTNRPPSDHRVDRAENAQKRRKDFFLRRIGDENSKNEISDQTDEKNGERLKSRVGLVPRNSPRAVSPDSSGKDNTGCKEKRDLIRGER